MLCNFCNSKESKIFLTNKKEYCSKYCLYRAQAKRINIQCTNCNKTFEKVYSQYKKSINHFCSRSCSATFNNKQKPKKLLTGSCKTCNTKLVKSRRYCDSCWNTRSLKETLENKTLAELKKNNKFHKAIRQQARQIYFGKEKKTQCENCSWNNFVEVAHIKPIKSFQDSDFIKDINHKDNLIGLCPNCHWLLDNGKLKLA